MVFRQVLQFTLHLFQALTNIKLTEEHVLCLRQKAEFILGELLEKMDPVSEKVLMAMFEHPAFGVTFIL